MNENNLEYLKKELDALHFSPALHGQLEKLMQQQLPEFQLKDKLPTEKGQVNFTLHFRKSNQTDHYFFNKYDSSLPTLPALEKGQKYLVISADPEAKKSSVTTFQNPVEAIRHIKKLEGNHELAVGKSPKDMTMLATKEGDKIEVMEKDFKQTFYKPDISHTFYLDKGKGFTAQQAANLLQGRSVFRDDFISLEGQPYQAWTKLDFDQPKDQHGNYALAQYHHPAYGFDLEKTLSRYAIKELQEPAAVADLLHALRQGEKPQVMVMKEGQEVKVFLEAAPRFKNLNMFNEQGKPEKREQFEIKANQEKNLERGSNLSYSPEESKEIRHK